MATTHDESRAGKVSIDEGHRAATGSRQSNTAATDNNDLYGTRTATNSPDNATPVRLSKSSTSAGHAKHASHQSQSRSPPSSGDDEISQAQTQAQAPYDDNRKASVATYVERRPWDRQRELERHAEAGIESDLKDADYHPEYDQRHSDVPGLYAGSGAGLGISDGSAPQQQPQSKTIQAGGIDTTASRASQAARPHAEAAPHSYGRYDDAAEPLKTRRFPDYDEEGQFEEFQAWKRRQPRQNLRTHRQRTLSYGQGHHPELHHSSRSSRHNRRDSDSDSEAGARIPFLNWMSWTAKGHLVAFFGEFVGTTMFLFFAFAGAQAAKVQPLTEQAATSGAPAATGFNAAVLLYISLVFGFSLMINVWIFFRVSGGLFNPAVTFAMLLVRVVTPFRALLLFIAQLVGSILASYLVKVVFPSNFNARTSLSSETSLTRGVFIEAILTAELVFTIFMLAKEKHKATFIAPIGIGLALFIAELVGVYYTGGSLNPARSFGPCVVTGYFNKEHWIYWAGPGLGAVFAVVFYKFITVMQYELANPGQDESSERRAAEAAQEAEVLGQQMEEDKGVAATRT